jgi:hypothetical protein
MIANSSRSDSPSTETSLRSMACDGFPTQRVTSQVYNTETPAAIAFAQILDAASFMAWAFKDQLIKRLDAEIDSEKDDPNALTIEERQKRAALVMGDLRVIERQEAALMFKGWSEGLSIQPREDLDPVAMLNV